MSMHFILLPLLFALSIISALAGLARDVSDLDASLLFNSVNTNALEGPIEQLDSDTDYSQSSPQAVAADFNFETPFLEPIEILVENPQQISSDSQAISSAKSGVEILSSVLPSQQLAITKPKCSWVRSQPLCCVGNSYKDSRGIIVVNSCVKCKHPLSFYLCFYLSPFHCSGDETDKRRESQGIRVVQNGLGKIGAVGNLL